VSAVLLLWTITGCSALHPGSEIRTVTGNSSIAAIELVSPTTVSHEGAITTFPSGKYRAAFEDDHGYYFEAPSKIFVDDVAVYAYEGGVYMEKGKTVPTQWYIVKPTSGRTMGHFRHPPPVRIISR
jgi:hypothetical protein